MGYLRILPILIFLVLTSQTIQVRSVLSKAGNHERGIVQSSHAGTPTSHNKIAFISDLEGGQSLYVIDPDHSDVKLVAKFHSDEGRIEREALVLSPDRKQLAFMTIQRNSATALWISKPDGSGARRLTDYIKGLIHHPFFVSWSPKGDRIAFVITRERSSEINVINADGSNLHFVAKGEWCSWSPDGSQLALTTFVPGQTGRFLAVVNVDGSNLRRIGGGHTSDCSWSPDGKRIAFREYRTEPATEGKFDVFLTDPKGSAKETVIENQTLYSRLVWSPNGEFLSFVSKLQGNRGLYAFQSRELARDRFRFFPGVDVPFAWSSDGKRIAHGYDVISIVDLRTNKSRILPHTERFGFPVWLPDGNRLILFEGASSGISKPSSDYVNLYVTQVEPQRLTRLTSDIEVEYISCSPDGKRIAFSARPNVKTGPRSSAVYSINSDGSDLRKLCATSVRSGWFAWSPDGSKIAFVSEMTECSGCRPGDLQISVANADGSNERIVVGEPAWNFAPAWRDEKGIVFLSDRGNTHAVYATDANGKQTKLLTDVSEFLRHHSYSPVANQFVPLFWSPDATKLATIRLDSERYKIGTHGIQIIDTSKRTSHSIPGIRPWILGWLPNNQRITLGDLVHDQVMNSITPGFVYLVDSGGSSKVTLTPDNGLGGDPLHGCNKELVWSPDGNRFACDGITISDANGSNQRWIIRGRNPGWVQ
jgi:Tol biopolymer transport system component